MSDMSKSASSFGPNIWLIDEMYRQFRENPESVAESWREFFSDYRPSSRLHRSEAAAPAEELELPAGAELIRGGAARIVENMEHSLHVPTATSGRSMPVTLLVENRRLINQHLAHTLGGRLSFTHLIAWAVLQALKKIPVMAASFFEKDGASYRVSSEHVNLGIAVDVAKADGSRTLFVPNIKHAEALGFDIFFAEYNELLRRVHANRISPADFAGTTVTLTNPGMIGTMHSAPRLMEGQGLIIATGAIDFPPEYRSADPHTIAQLGISKVMSVIATYDHRIIQGAESGEFLHTIDLMLSGGMNFYDDVFASLKIPYHPIRLSADVNPAFERGTGGLIDKNAGVLQLINMYRVRGHLQAHLNPLSDEPFTPAELDPGRYGLSLWDLDREFVTGGLSGKPRSSLREILDILRDAYCRTIGVEYMFIQEPAQKSWIQQRVEGVLRESWTTPEIKRRILEKLNASEAFEKFLHTKYVGHKRFSLEGAETLIPMLDDLLSQAAESGIEEAVMGMAHRGRLNVLANIIGKSYQKIFREFEGDIDPDSRLGSGDVKYHLGASGVHTSPGGRSISLTLASNPSHLEAVDPVVEGMTRAKQDLRGDTENAKVLPILIHGDAAFAGQGVVAETLNLSALSGYCTGGTVHIVVNNGIGFTTATVDARSSVYATDIAKMVQAPIFHVNGDDPEACNRVIELAFAFRQEFQKDVVVDMICYRRHGHSEGDEPSYTQPLMYASIDQKRSVRKLYTEALVNGGDLTLAEAEAALEDFHERLETAFKVTHDSAPPLAYVPREAGVEAHEPEIATGVDREILDEIVQGLTNVPAGFEVHPKLTRQIDARRGVLSNNAVDWATAEALAFGSLLLEGTPVRLSGQDSRRGTFSQRHSVLVDYRDGAVDMPLNHIRPEQAHFMSYDSLLSEYAVLGFEYGYSVAWKKALVLWEAQFGDFMNGAQIIIDQFIAAAEDKWGQTSRLVMLLPHGYEGQGPEHSSARIERFLTLCSGDNLQVCVPSSAAQYFHLLRRQIHSTVPKPLILVTVKSLLRAEPAKSPTSDFVGGGFMAALDDPAPPPHVKRLLLCSGKVAHELLDFRRKHANSDTVIIRIEQLYPFPERILSNLFTRYPDAADIRWVQEEPGNMGAWNYIRPRIKEILPSIKSVRYIGRMPSASPATGSQRMHLAEQEMLIQQAFE